MTSKKTKNVKAAGKKSPSGKSRASAAGRSQKSPAPPEPVRAAGSGGWNPVAVLVIMALVTVIVVMANKFYLTKKPGQPAKPPVAAVGPAHPVIQPEKGVETEKKDSKADTAAKTGEEVKAPPQKKVRVYFIRLDEPTEKFYLSTVSRTVDPDAPLKNALEELIKGPTKGEEGRGYLTAVPDKLRVRKVTVNGNTATVDFNRAIEEGAAGNILLHRVDQIVYTATQFDGIDRVVILVDGKKKTSLGGDGLSIGGPLHRRK